MTDAVYPEVLLHLQSEVTQIRNAAEERLKGLETTPDYGLKLAEIIVGVGYEQPIGHRQLAYTLLKRYVESHWCHVSEKQVPPEPSDEVKERIRKLLFISLSDKRSNIRRGGAYVIAAMARFDWPSKWPGLLYIISTALKSSNPNLVDGAMDLLTELVNNLTLEQLQQSDQFLLSELLNIFMDKNHSLEMRCRTVSIFSSITTAIYAMLKLDKQAGHRIGYYLYLHRFADAFSKALAISDDGQLSEISLKTEIVKALGAAVDKFPKQIQKWMPHILPNIGELLEKNSLHYTWVVIYGDTDDTANCDPEALEQITYALIEFILSVVGERRFADHLKDAIPHLIRLLIIYIQIPYDTVKEWEDDVQRYVEDEDVESGVCSVRMSAIDLLANLYDFRKMDTICGLSSAVGRYVVESNQRKDSGDKNWWQIREACYTAMGFFGSGFFQRLKENPTNEFDIHDFLSTVLVPDITRPSTVFLQGHAIAFAGKIAHAMGHLLTKPLLDICSTGLLSRHHVVIRVCSCRAFYNFCNEAKHQGAVLSSLCDLRSVVSSLVALGARSSEAVLNLVLSTMATIIEVSPEAVTPETKAIPMITAAMLKYSGDPMIPEQVSEIVWSLMKVPHCRDQIERNMLPTVLSVTRCENKSRLPIRMPAVCMEILHSIIRGSPLPISDSLIAGFPIVVQCLLTTDETSALAAGRECIRAYISKASDKIINYNDGANTGVGLIVQVIHHLLSPAIPELSASMVGRLILILLKRASESIAPYLEQILQAVLYKMYASEMNSVHQSLIVVFAHLVHYQPEALVQFLSSANLPDGTPALRYVLSLWCQRQKCFVGSYDQKVSSLALCKLFLYAVSSADDTLRSLVVPETDLEIRTDVDSGEPASKRFAVPLLVKIFKLLIFELESLLEIRNRLAKTGTSDQNIINEDHPNVKGDELVQTLRELVSELHEDVDDGILDENNDPDLMDDEFASLDLFTEITGFLTQLSHQPYYQEFSDHLTEHERTILQQLKLM